MSVDYYVIRLIKYVLIVCLIYHNKISPLLLNDGLDKTNCTGGRVRFNADALKAFDG